MATYKVISTLTWKVNTDEGEEGCLNLVRSQLDQFLKPPILEDFCVQMDVALMKPRKRLEHIAFFPADEILDLITEEETRKEFIVDGESYWVRMNSDRYHVFRVQRQCCACGVVGDKMALDLNPGDSSPHFNLYAVENGQLLLLTKDHKIPKSKGGEDKADNYQTMCSVCNNLKGAYNLSLDSIRHLRLLHKNDDKLPRRELRDLINRRREELSIS